MALIRQTPLFIKSKFFILSILLIFAMGGGKLNLIAKEPTNWIFGFGVGVGQSTIVERYSDSANLNLGWQIFANHSGNSVKDWGVAWEFLTGYKHFLNKWVGFRYYANVGAQHYKDEIFTAGKVKAGIIEYTANADILLNFYNSELFTLGILGGFGIGGASFDSPALESYQKRWGPNENNPTNFIDRASYDEHKIKKHHLSASLSVGARFNIFQKIRLNSKRVCDEGVERRRTCKVPISYLEHSIEFNAKFNMLTHYPTKQGDMLGVTSNGAYDGSIPRPGYEVKNPYKFTLRYIFAF